MSWQEGYRVAPELAPIVTKLFERYATGQYSLKALTQAAHSDGLTCPKSGNPVPVSTVHMILHNRLYTRGWRTRRNGC
jgi:hypothetical protein